MFQRYSRFVSVIGVVLLGGMIACASPAESSTGVEVYALNCQGCHGAMGQGGLASALASPLYLSTHDDTEITQSIREGVPGTMMRAWSVSKGGPLTDKQIADTVAYLRSRGSNTTPVR